MNKRNLPVIVAAIVAIVAYGAVNRAANNITQPPSATDQTTTQTTPADEAKTATANKTESQQLITEATAGDVAKAKVRATLGYVVDNYVATHPDEANQTIKMVEAWANSNHTSSAQVVCLDIPPDLRTDPSTADVPLGLTINGRSVPNLNKNIGPNGITPQNLGEPLYRSNGPPQIAAERQQAATVPLPPPGPPGPPR